VTYNYSFYHFTFLLGAMFVSMLITNWKFLSKGIDSYEVDYGWGSVWVKFASSWLVILLYFWSLIAPLLFPNRQF